MIVAMKKQWVLHILSVFVDLGIQHAMRMRHVVICGLQGSAVYFHIIVNGTIFEEKILDIKCVLIFSTTFVWETASWPSGQGLWLLNMRSRVRFPVLPWEFFLAGIDSRGDHGLGS